MIVQWDSTSVNFWGSGEKYCTILLLNVYSIHMNLLRLIKICLN
jgi:hypothetical protein